MNKRIIALALTLLMLCTVPVFASPAEPEGSVTASYSGGKVTFSGSVIGDVKAVAALLFDPANNQIAMTTCDVTNQGTFFGSISIRLTRSGAYTVKVADYEGGAFFAKYTFNWTAPSSGSSSFQSVPVSEIDSGESFTETNIEKLISEGESLTVRGESGAMLVYDVDALEGISQQADGIINVSIADLSDEYQQTHPGKLVFSLTVKSGDKDITDFGGSVAVSLPYKLKEGETADNVTVWHMTTSGVLVEIPCTYDAATGLVSFKVSHFSVYIVGVAGEWTNPFDDVGITDWFYDQVRFVYENGMMVGTSHTAFSPQDNTSRGMIVTILYRLEGTGTPETGTNTFSDVATGKYYTDAVAWAVENEIVSGYGDGRFGPEDAITREQMAVILMNYAKFKGYYVSMNSDLSKYADEDAISNWAKEAISWANATSLIQGDGSKLMPIANAKRSQVAANLQRFFENIAK
jgi:hypothetical protein